MPAIAPTSMSSPAHLLPVDSQPTDNPDNIETSTQEVIEPNAEPSLGKVGQLTTALGVGNIFWGIKNSLFSRANHMLGLCKQIRKPIWGPLKSSINPLKPLTCPLKPSIGALKPLDHVCEAPFSLAIPTAIMITAGLGLQLYDYLEAIKAKKQDEKAPEPSPPSNIGMQLAKSLISYAPIFYKWPAIDLIKISAKGITGRCWDADNVNTCYTNLQEAGSNALTGLALLGTGVAVALGSVLLEAAIHKCFDKPQEKPVEKSADSAKKAPPANPESSKTAAPQGPITPFKLPLKPVLIKV